MDNNENFSSGPAARLLVAQAWPSVAVSAAWPMFGRTPLAGDGRARVGRRRAGAARRHGR